MNLVVTFLLGSAVGVPLGLTGAGGSIMAVPILVYGLSVPAHDAVGISLCTVGATAWIGTLTRLRDGLIDVWSVLVFAAAGVLGTPIGAWIGSRTSERLLLTLFGFLMLVVALRMLRSKTPDGDEATSHTGNRPLLAVIGFATGVLASLFGVGGGFLIVPSLVIVAGLGVRRAMTTSLAVIALISTAGVINFLRQPGGFDLDLAALFTAGSLAGLALGSVLARQVSGVGLRRAFATLVLSVAVFVTVQNLFL